MYLKNIIRIKKIKNKDENQDKIQKIKYKKKKK